jgi:LuxR family maltose regulon positive regulatory protein
LIERLDEGLLGPSGLRKGLRFARKLTLVSAPAGFGKTTLLSEWVADYRKSKIGVAWLSLDAGDNDPARFLAYLIAAFETVEENVGRGTLGALQSPGFAIGNTSPPMEELLTTLINQINVIPDGLILVLDDYHLITAQPVHDALSFLLDHLPRNVHLVIATRVDPPLPIARLRGHGQLTELHQTDLRFTLDEIAEFLNRVMGLELSADDVATLASRTEGWITGLQMAAISMQGREDTATFIQAFTGSNRYILDYLVEEVLQRQLDSVQAFLLQTAILDRLSGPLCDAVLGISESASQRISKSANGQISKVMVDQRSGDLQVCRFADLQTCRFADSSSRETLEYLERANLFVVPLDNERKWYRYHRLFADLLRQRLHQTQADLVPTLHGRAGAWYEQNGPMTAAIDHALSAGDLEWAADLIEQEAEATLMHGEIVTLLRWVDMLPAELARLHPSLCTYHAWALLMGGRPWEAVRSRLEDIDREAERIPGKAAPLRAWIAMLQGRISRAAELARQALERLPDDDLFLRDVAIWSLALFSADDDIVAGTQALEEVARTSRETGNVMIEAMALCNLAELYMKQGRLRQARATYQQALDLSVDNHGLRLPIAGEALIGLGELAREWNDLDMATRYLTEGIELSGRLGQARALEGYIYLAHVRQAQGDVDGAREAIEKARRLAIEFDATDLDDIMVGFHQAQLWITQGNLKAARRWTEERGLDGGIGPARLRLADTFVQDRMRKYEQLVLARLLIAEERPAEALALLDEVLPTVNRRGRIGRVIEIHVLKALAFQALGDEIQAMGALERALSLAQPQGYVRLFVDAGPEMGLLLRRALSRGIAPEYVRELLAVFDRESLGFQVSCFEPVSAPVVQPGPETQLIEPLSEREIEVLRLLTTGLSSTEIAEELVISANTVRFHTKNIYGKLGVHRRSDAVDRARGLGLL